MHKLILVQRADMAHYKAENLVLGGCIDERFAEMFDEFFEWLKQEGSKYIHIDRVIFAGGGWNLAEDGSVAQQALMEQIAISVELHETLTITVVTHEDCGAAGKEAQCRGDRHKQFLVHAERHRKINAAIVARYSQFRDRIRNFYLSRNGMIEFDLNRTEELSEKELTELALLA